MKKHISALFAAAALVVLAACNATPTAVNTAEPGAAQANTAEAGDAPANTPADTTTGRVPNMMGSGN